MFSLMQLFCDFYFPKYALNINIFPHEVIFQILMPNICTELYVFPYELISWLLIPYICIRLKSFPSWNYFAIFNAQYLHCTLMSAFKKFFWNFFEIFNAQYLHWALMFSLKNLFNYFYSQYMHWALMFSLMKLYCNFVCPIFALHFTVFPPEIILLFLRPNICTEFWCFQSRNYF